LSWRITGTPFAVRNQDGGLALCFPRISLRCIRATGAFFLAMEYAAIEYKFNAKTGNNLFFTEQQ
jgi:hypothetical protein